MISLSAVLLIWLSDGTQMRYEYPDAAACGAAILRLVEPAQKIDPGVALICEPVEAGPPARSPRPRPRP